MNIKARTRPMIARSSQVPSEEVGVAVCVVAAGVGTGAEDCVADEASLGGAGEYEDEVARGVGVCEVWVEDSEVVCVEKESCRFVCVEGWLDVDVDTSAVAAA